MENDKLTDLLTRFDEGAPEAGAVSGDLAGVVRRRAWRQRRTRGIIVKAAAMVVIAVLGTWAVIGNNSNTGKAEPLAGTGQPLESIVNLEAEVAQLSAKVDSLLSLLEETRIDRGREKRIVTLQAELSSIGDPVEEMNRNIDKVVINLLYKADKIKDEHLAVKAYERIIKLFPDNYYADVAREKIKEITSKQVNNFQKGDLT